MNECLLHAGTYARFRLVRACTHDGRRFVAWTSGIGGLYPFVDYGEFTDDDMSSVGKIEAYEPPDEEVARRTYDGLVQRMLAGDPIQDGYFERARA